jgi:opacity protein-like surface antigen
MVQLEDAPAARPFGEESRMIGSWRPLALAAALNVTLVVAAASAQSVIVVHAPPGSTIDVAMNTAAIGSATADAQGQATVPLGAAALGGRPSINVRLYVDRCETTRRVVLVEPGLQAAPAGACVRQDIPGVYRMLPASTFVVDVGTPEPSVRLRQGPAPAEWFVDEADRPKKARPDVTPQAGFMLFAGGGVGVLNNAITIGCGNVTACEGGTTKLAGQAGVTIWATKYLAIEGAYVKHLGVSAVGSGTDYKFDHSFSTHVATATLKLGLPLNRARPYILGGVNHTWSTTTTSQSVDDTTVTVDTTTTTIPGGSQTFEWESRGWGWVAGLGIEIPVTRMWTIYTEAGAVKLRGDDSAGGEGRLDDRILYGVVGLRIRLGK